MNGIDCGEKLNSTSAQALKNAGIEVVGRYLGRTLWNGLTPGEVEAIHNAGLALLLIWELDPTNKSYFTRAKGLSDAKQAIVEAEYLGAPHGAVINFTVDFDAQPGDMDAIIEYFGGVRDGLEGKYLVGAYGSNAVMMALDGSANAPDRFFQTYAWSKGKVFPKNDYYQYQNEVVLAGIKLDRDEVSEVSGLWGDIDMLNVAVVLNTSNDFWAGADVSAKNGNCAMFIRGSDTARTVPSEAMKAKKLFVVGGTTAGHPNEVLLSGQDKYDTAASVKRYLG